MAVERIASGIPGLDKLIEGGFVKGSTILVTGGTGTGKTTFCAQFLWEGLKRGEPGIYITMEEETEDIKTDMKLFGWDFSKYEKANKFSMIYQNPFEVSDVSATIMDGINSVNAQRIVVDPISILGMYMKDEASMRKRFFNLTRRLKTTGCTTLITSEVLEEELERKGLSRYGVIEFIVDGIIILNIFGAGGGSARSIQIRKMRRTHHGADIYPMEISKKGIVVRKSE